jgi:hypothetical protein
MKHIRNFNESMEEEEFHPEESHMDEEPRFTLHQLEAAFMSARYNVNGKPRFADFKDWFTSELGSSHPDVVPNYQFRDQSRFPF